MDYDFFDTIYKINTLDNRPHMFKQFYGYPTINKSTTPKYESKDKIALIVIVGQF